MAAKMKSWMIAGCVFLFVTLAIGGCSGGDTDSAANLSLEEYFERTENAMRRAEERTADAASEPFDGDAIEKGADILRDLRDDIREIVPPAEVAAEHNALRDVLGNLSAHIDDLLDRVAQANSRAELDALNEEWLDNPKGNELEDRVRSACRELQEAADTREISVDLCYESGSRE
jgi:hypothetical protein